MESNLAQPHLISNTVAQLRLAEATITVFVFIRHASIYRLHTGVDTELGAALPLDYTTLHVQVDGLSIVIDPFQLDLDEIAACRSGGARFTELTAGPAGALMAAGINPSEVTHVIATHGHYDHFGGVRLSRNELAFPAARHVISAADWHDETAKHWPRLRASWQEPAEIGLIDLIDGPQLQISPSIMLLHTPGDTPGHYAVQISTGIGQCYLVGDLFHHWHEVEQPSAYNRNLPTLRGLGGAELPKELVDQQRESRLAVAAVAADTGALVIPSHMAFPGMGWIRRRTVDGKAMGFTWVPIGLA